MTYGCSALAQHLRIDTVGSDHCSRGVVIDSLASGCATNEKCHSLTKMSFLERRTSNVILTVAFFILLGALIYSARRVLLIFVFAVFFAYLINPIVKFMQTHSLFFRNLRGPAVLEVYLALVLVTAGAGYAFAPRVVTNTGKLVDEVPAVLDGLASGEIATQLAGEYGWSAATEVRFKTFLVRHRDGIQDLAANVDRFLVNAAHVIGYVLLIPILTIFILRDGEQLASTWIEALSPAERRAEIRAALCEVHAVLGKYMSAQVLLCALSLGFYLVTLLALHCPHAVALAILGGFLEFIPIAGWLTTFAAVLSVAVVSHSHWMWMAILFLLWRVLQDYLFCPRIMGSHLKIHPLAAIFAILVGAEVGGIVGVYLAIPLMASVRVIWQMWAARESNAGESSRRPAVTAELLISSTLPPLGYIEPVLAHAKAD
jgi:predicted PurR-regulated permease PerM